MLWKSNNCPSILCGRFVETVVALNNRRQGVPVIAIGLYDYSLLGKYKVWLPPSKHCLMHHEAQLGFFEHVPQASLDYRHLLGQNLTQSGLSISFSAFLGKPSHSPKCVHALFLNSYTTAIRTIFLTTPACAVRWVSALRAHALRWLAPTRLLFTALRAEGLRLLDSSPIGRKVVAATKSTFAGFLTFHSKILPRIEERYCEIAAKRCNEAQPSMYRELEVKERQGLLISE